MAQNNSEKSPTIISEKSLVPISFVLILLGGAYRIESTAFSAKNSEKEISILKTNQDQMARDISDVKTILARIEGAMNLPQHQKKDNEKCVQ